MDRFERLEIIDRLQAEIAEGQVDLAERRARGMAGEPDALMHWAAGMPPREQKKQEHRVDRAQMETMVLRREIDRMRSEATAYRVGLETALGCVIADQRKAMDAVRAEIAELRSEVRREPIELPALRLVGGRDD